MESTAEISSAPNGVDPHELCAHCGQILPLTRKMPSREGFGPFCCSGCEFVFRTIRELGLSDFYRYREARGHPINFLPGEENYTSYDTTEFLNRHSSLREDNSRVVTLHLSGIHCAGCLWLIENLPRILPGVTEARLNFGTGTLRLTFDPTRRRLSKIISTLESLGYRATSLSQDPSIETTKEERRLLLRLGIAAVCAMNSMMLAVSLWQGMFTGIEIEYARYFRWISVALAVPAVFYSAIPFYRTAIGALRLRRLHIDLPISIAILGAFGISVANTALDRSSVYFDSVTALICLLLIGRLVHFRALTRARLESRQAWGIIPTLARKLEGDTSKEVDVSTLIKGDVIEVRSAERIPVDGEIIDGCSSIDRSILTGESVPIQTQAPDLVHAGTLNLEAPVRIRVNTCGAETRFGRLLSQLREYEGKRSRIVEITERASAWFVSIVLLLALFTLVYWWKLDPFLAIDHTVALLVVSCPCALGFATPLALGVAVGRAAKLGILIKGSDTLDRLSRVTQVFIDKTGTLTYGKLGVTNCNFLKTDFSPDRQKDAFTVIGLLAKASVQHPVAAAISKWSATHKDQSELVLSSIHLSPGRGISGHDQSGRVWRMGSIRWMQELDLLPSPQPLLAGPLSAVILACDSNPIAILTLIDKLRPEAREFSQYLLRNGIPLHILSGDRTPVVQQLARELQLDPSLAKGDLFPEEKASEIRTSAKFRMMVGDGVNDCAAMKCADIAVGLRGGLEVSAEVSDVFIPDQDLQKVAIALQGAKRVMTVIKRNLCFSLTYNIIGALAAILGWVNPIVAAVIMPLSSLTVISSSVFSKTFTDKNENSPHQEFI